MNLKLLILGALMVASCSKDIPKIEQRFEETNVKWEAEPLQLEITDSVTSFDTASVNLLIEEGQSISQKIFVNNKTYSAKDIGVVALSTFVSSGVSINSSDCNNVTLNRKQKCMIELILDASLMTATTEVGSLSILGEIIPVNIEVISATVQPSVTSVVNVSPIIINFPEVYQGQIARRTVILKNRSRRTVSIDIGSFLSADFTVESTTCGTSLSRYKACFVNLAYNAPASVALDSVTAETITLAGTDVSYNINLKAPTSSACITEADWIFSGFSGTDVDLRQVSSVSVLVKNRSRIARTLCVDYKLLDQLNISVSGCESDVGRLGSCYLVFNLLNAQIDHDIELNGITHTIKSQDTVACLGLDAATCSSNVSCSYDEGSGLCLDPLNLPDTSHCSIETDAATCTSDIVCFYDEGLGTCSPAFNSCSLASDSVTCGNDASCFWDAEGAVCLEAVIGG